MQTRGSLGQPLSDGADTRVAPSVWRVHLALIGAQLMFAGGSVVGKLGVAQFNPMIFALIREATAGVMLLAIVVRVEGWQPPQMKDAALFLLCGFFIFTNQAAFIVGDKLAGAVLASAWQPTQPVFTLIISLCLRWEAFTLGKAAGILISFGGAAFMVSFGANASSAASAEHTIAGNGLLFLNCLGTSLYVIMGKVVLSRGYSPLCVTAWSYLCGACMMAVVSSGFSSSCALVNFICADGDHPCGPYRTSCDPWAVPTDAILPLAYWVLFNSIAAYLLMTWGNAHAKAGFVLAYCALQPLGAMTLSAIIISTAGDGTDLTMPGLNALGALPILLGLAIILHEGRAQHAHDAQAKLLAPPLEPSAHEPQPDVYAAPPDRYEAPRTEQQGVGGTRSARVVPAGSAA